MERAALRTNRTEGYRSNEALRAQRRSSEGRSRAA